MEQYISNDNTVAKYVHDDGSETAIKTLNPNDVGCGGSGRNKFNVFASCSVGCPVNCAFCYLTTKGFKYERLDYQEITSNINDAIEMELIRRPELMKIPMNISWMGMGDAWLDLDTISNVVSDVMLDWKNVLNFEGVDISTTLPTISNRDITNIKDINKTLLDSGKLSVKEENRSHVRVFYSLHSLKNEVRKRLIPRTLDLHISLPYLEDLGKKFNVIYHYMFLEGINDKPEDIDALIRYFRAGDKQLRILRYNKCPNSKFDESRNFNNIIKKLLAEIPNLKVQISPGGEVKAACGMFIMSNN